MEISLFFFNMRPSRESIRSNQAPVMLKEQRLVWQTDSSAGKHARKKKKKNNFSCNKT